MKQRTVLLYTFLAFMWSSAHVTVTRLFQPPLAFLLRLLRACANTCRASHASMLLSSQSVHQAEEPRAMRSEVAVGREDDLTRTLLTMGSMAPQFYSDTIGPEFESILEGLPAPAAQQLLQESPRCRIQYPWSCVVHVDLCATFVPADALDANEEPRGDTRTCRALHGRNNGKRSCFEGAARTSSGKVMQTFSSASVLRNPTTYAVDGTRPCSRE